MKLEQLAGVTDLDGTVGESTVDAWIRERRAPLFRTIPGVEEDGWVAFHREELRRHAAADGALVVHAPELPAVFVARALDWDTGILGVPLAILDYALFPASVSGGDVAAALRELFSMMRDRGWRLVVHKSCPADIDAMAAVGRAGFDLLCMHLEFLFDTASMAEQAAPLEGYVFEEARPEDEAELGELSARNHAAMDRFRVDPCVPQDRVPEVYREWARNSVRGYADLVWVARKDDVIVGFGTWGSRSRLAEHTGVRCAEYQLGAVAESERNRGLFRRITAGALVELARRGETWGSGATNSLNTPTQRCFQSLGAWVHAPILTFRKDLDVV